MSKLENQENFEQEYSDRIEEWELYSVALISREIGNIGKMTPDKAEKYNAEKKAKKSERLILSALTTALLLNIEELPKTYASLFNKWHKGNEYLYDYRKIKFVDVADNKGLQKIIKSYSKKKRRRIY